MMKISLFTHMGSIKLITNLIENILNEALSEKSLKKLYVWDFDDSLVTTDAKVIIRKPDGSIRLKLTSHEYASEYTPEKGDILDASEFNKLVKPKPIKWTIKILRKIIAKRGTDSAVILTARSSPQGVIQFFRKYKIPQIPVIALGTPGAGSSPEAKAQWILNTAKKYKYDTIEFFDDSEANINAVKSIRDQVPKTKIITRLVKA